MDRRELIMLMVRPARAGLLALALARRVPPERVVPNTRVIAAGACGPTTYEFKLSEPNETRPVSIAAFQ